MPAYLDCVWMVHCWREMMVVVVERWRDLLFQHGEHMSIYIK